MPTITYDDKETLIDHPEIPVEKKFSADDANEVKTVVNQINTNVENVQRVANVTVPSTAIAFDFNHAYRGVFTITTAIAAQKTVAFVLDENARVLEFTIQITNVAGALNFGSGSAVKMADGRFNNSTKIWTPEEVGKYEGVGKFDGTDWLISISKIPWPL